VITKWLDVKVVGFVVEEEEKEKTKERKNRWREI